tara:strand:- start:1928 stop:2350 length:423 start_codon:yes stop_codon:yes gene_type:complete
MKYSIALNSRDRVNGGLANDCEFPFDFGVFKQAEYEMTFTLVSDPADLSSTAKSCSIFSNTGGSNVYTTSNVNSANTTQFIGSVNAGGLLGLTASTTDNGGIYMTSPPREQTIKIRVLDGTGTPFTTCPEWIMMMTFTKL